LFNKLLKLILILFITSSAHADEVMKLGLEVFNKKAGCNACHVLKAAGSEGNVGPSLDSLNPSPTVEQVKDIVTHGLGVMPAFGEEGLLTNEEIDAVSIYVAKTAGK